MSVITTGARRRLTALALIAATLGVAASASAATWSESITSGPVTATLETTYTDTWEDVMIADDLALTITRSDGGPSALFAGPQFGPVTVAGDFVMRSGAVRLRDLNGDGDPEALVEVYTGGAHCCFVTYVATRSAPGGYVLLTRWWGNLPGKVVDLDADGIPELVGHDDRFAAAFGPYAVSVIPAAVWDLRSGALRMTTDEYPVFARAWTRRYHRIAQLRHRRGEGVMAAVAAYVAEASTLGPVAAAGALVRAQRMLPGTRGARTLRQIRTKLTGWGYLPATP